MSYLQLEADYQHIATVQLRLIRQFSPNASAALERIYTAFPHAARAVYRAALTVTMYKFELERQQKPPTNFNPTYLLSEFPEAVPFAEDSIRCLIEDWRAASAKPHEQSHDQHRHDESRHEEQASSQY